MRLRAAIVVMVILSTSAPVDAARPRRALLEYELDDAGASFGAPGHGGFGAYDRSGSYEFPLRKGETAVSVMVLDDVDRPVAAVVAQRVEDSRTGNASFGRAVTYEKFCGRTESPVKVVPDVTVHVFIQKGACDDGTPSTPTTGDIVVDFHRR